MGELMFLQLQVRELPRFSARQKEMLVRSWAQPPQLWCFDSPLKKHPLNRKPALICPQKDGVLCCSLPAQTSHVTPSARKHFACTGPPHLPQCIALLHNVKICEFMSPGQQQMTGEYTHVEKPCLSQWHVWNTRTPEWLYFLFWAH